jgi:hypothetical protein
MSRCSRITRGQTECCGKKVTELCLSLAETNRTIREHSDGLNHTSVATMDTNAPMQIDNHKPIRLNADWRIPDLEFQVVFGFRRD